MIQSMWESQSFLSNKFKSGQLTVLKEFVRKVKTERNLEKRGRMYVLGLRQDSYVKVHTPVTVKMYQTIIKLLNKKHW